MTNSLRRPRISSRAISSSLNVINPLGATARNRWAASRMRDTKAWTVSSGSCAAETNVDSARPIVDLVDGLNAAWSALQYCAAVARLVKPAVDVT